jgi:FixJ family two-component response regulator
MASRLPDDFGGVALLIVRGPGIGKKLDCKPLIWRARTTFWQMKARRLDKSALAVPARLGDISGMELGRHLAASGFMFPIIFMTGSQDELTRTQAVKFGCVAYLQKPLKAAELNEAISLAIGKSVRKGKFDFRANH